MNLSPKNHLLTLGIADDDIVFRRLLISELCKNMSRRIVFCVTNGYDLIEFTKIYKPAVIIVDLYMPHMSGLEAIKCLSQINYEVKVVAYSDIFQQDVLSELKKIPVEGYCKCKVQDIATCLNYIQNDKTYLNDTYFSAWKKEKEKLLTTQSNSITEKLSGTEIKIVLLATDGKTNIEISRALHLSKRTIDTYIGNILKKLQLNTKNDLVRFAFQNGLCTLSCSNSKRNLCIHKSILQLDNDNLH